MEIRTRKIDANGIRFAIDEAGDGDRVALCLHGFPESRIAWRAQLPFLAEQGWHAVAPDLRGFGESTRLSGREPYRIQHLTDDVAALFNALGAKKRLLIGHDWGGVIAWATAIRDNAKLDGLVILNAPHPAVYRRVLRQGSRQALRSWYVLFFQLPGLPEFGLARNRGRELARMLSRQSPNFAPDVLAVYAKNISQPGAATAMVNYYRANISEIGTMATSPGKIAAPTPMIWGEDDFALDIALTEGNEDFVRDFSLVKLPGVSHWVQEDASPQANAAIAQWLGEKRIGADG